MPGRATPEGGGTAAANAPIRRTEAASLQVRRVVRRKVPCPWVDVGRGAYQRLTEPPEPLSTPFHRVVTLPSRLFAGLCRSRRSARSRPPLRGKQADCVELGTNSRWRIGQRERSAGGQARRVDDTHARPPGPRGGRGRRDPDGGRPGRGGLLPLSRLRRDRAGPPLLFRAGVAPPADRRAAQCARAALAPGSGRRWTCPARRGVNRPR